MRDFENKIVVISGAGSGMGRAYAEAFGRRGAKLALNDVNPEGLAQTVALLRQQGVTHILEQVFDVADAAAFMAFATSVQEAFGPAHVVINNAGIEGAQKPAWALSEQELDRIMAVNFRGVVNGSRVFLPQLMSNQEGALVNVSSIFGLVGTPNSADYCASKFAVRGYTEALMVELQNSPIYAYLVHPGGIATNIVQKSAGQDFNARFLTTPPEAIAEHLIRCIGRRKLRIVFGNHALRTWLASWALPLKWRNAVLWRELKGVTDQTHYPRR